MLSIFRAVVERLKALVLTSAALEVESEFVARDAERQAELLRQANRYETEGLCGIAQHLRQQADRLSVERPLACVLPAVAHLQADIPDGTETPALPAREPTILPGPTVSRPALTLLRPKKRGGKS